MKSSFAAVLVAVAGASAAFGDNATYITEVVTAITTYCPEATTFTHAGTTYSITKVRFEELGGEGGRSGLLGLAWNWMEFLLFEGTFK
ncbi:unnamed protein product [Discula destructiva]